LCACSNAEEEKAKIAAIEKKAEERISKAQNEAKTKISDLQKELEGAKEKLTEAEAKAKEAVSKAETDFFQGVDVLLIDDFQFLQGRSMQQEFCHTFNSLVDSKRQVIIAGDLPPAQLESIDDRTRSRLAGGLVVDIEPAELDLRRAILKMRLDDARKRECTIDIDDDVLDYVANKIQSGGRELEGALTRIVANQQLVQARMTVDMAAQALRDLVRPSDSRRIKIDDIPLMVGDVVEVRAIERPVRLVEPEGSLPFWDLFRHKVELLPS
jgi:chromosomal replication initiation ATPase DnaA